MPYQRDSHATSQTAIYANITQTGRIRVYCSWFWDYMAYWHEVYTGFGSFWLVLLVLWVVLGGFVGGFRWFRVLVTTDIVFSHFPFTSVSDTVTTVRQTFIFQRRCQSLRLKTLFDH